MLKEDNARLKSIINNDSSNTSLPPYMDQKGGKPANTYNGRKKTGCKPGGQNGHTGTTLTKAQIEQKLASGRRRHEIRTIGKRTGQDYVTKYVVDLNVETVITEIRVYADKNGMIRIPARYCSDVTYGENVKALAVSLSSESVMSDNRIASFLNTAGNGELGLSEGSVYGFCRKFAEMSEESILHFVRYLRKNTEETGNRWSDQMISLLCEMNQYRKELMAQGLDAMPAERITEYEGKYCSILKQGREENKAATHKYAKQDEVALLGRMETYSHNQLLFLHDFSVPSVYRLMIIYQKGI